MISNKGATIQVFDESIDGFVYLNPDEIKSIEVVKESDKDSNSLPSSYCKLMVKTQKDVERLFEFQKKFTIFFNGIEQDVFCANGVTQPEPDVYTITGRDFLFLFEHKTFDSVIWAQPNDIVYSNAYKAFYEYLDTLDMPFEIDENVKNNQFVGLVNNVPALDGLLEMAFGSGVRLVVGDKLYVKGIVSDSDIKTVSAERILEGYSAEKKEKGLIKVCVQSETYPPVETRAGIYKATGLVDGFGKKLGKAKSVSAYLPTTRDGHPSLKVVFHSKADGDVNYLRDVNEPVKVLIQTSSMQTDTELPLEYLTNVTINAEMFYADFPSGRELGEIFGTPSATIYHDIYVVFSVLDVEEKETSSFVYGSGSEYAVTKTAQPVKTVTIDTQEQVAQRLYDSYMTSDDLRCRIADRKIVKYGEPYRYGEALYGTLFYGERRPSVILYDDKVDVGDTVRVDLGHGGVFVKTVVRQKYKLCGNFLVKDCTLR